MGENRAQYFFKLNFKKGIKFELVAVDISEEGLKNMLSYIEVQLSKFSEKNFSQIIEIYSEEPVKGSKEYYFKKIESYYCQNRTLQICFFHPRIILILESNCLYPCMQLN